MATNKSDKSSVTAEKVVKRQKKQARREAKLMSEIEAAKEELKKAQKKQSKALARLEDLRAQSPQAATGKEPTPLPSEETSLPEGSVVMIDAAKMDALQ